MIEMTWQKLYDNVKPITPVPVLVGFNVNLDRIIFVTPELLTSGIFNLPVLSDLRSRLFSSMHTCTAEEWIVSDQLLYQQITRIFADSGHLFMGGQAGIAAVHLASSGCADVLCVALSPGPETRKILDNAGVHLMDSNTGSNSPEDTIHLVFEYPPGLVPVAEGVILRNNRFIVSPAHSPESILVPCDEMNAFSARIRRYTRAFLSGYQYLRTEAEFARAADQILLMKQDNNRIRVHVECVSATDTRVIRGFIHSILPVADSIGLNENELVLLLHCLDPQKPEYRVKETLSAIQQVMGALDLCNKTGLKRLHLHTFGYYVLVIRNDCAQPEASRNALIFASRAVARAARGSGGEISPAGILAYGEIEKIFGPSLSKGIFRTNTHTIVMIPTIIAQNITKTSGLGDILSSSAFVADLF